MALPRTPCTGAKKHVLSLLQRVSTLPRLRRGVWWWQTLATGLLSVDLALLAILLVLDGHESAWLIILLGIVIQVWIWGGLWLRRRLWHSAWRKRLGAVLWRYVTTYLGR